MLVSLLPDHKIYVEPFLGAGSILFGKAKCKCEAVNDLDGNLINFWKVCRDDHEALIRSFECIPNSKQAVDTYWDKYCAGEYESDLERAHIFYCLVVRGLGEDMRSLIFERNCISHSAFSANTIEQTISDVYERLIHVQIECQDFTEVMHFYDSPDTVYYLDPPYHDGCHKCVTHKFDDERCQELADICKNLKGKFLLTINDDDFMRDTFKDFNVNTYETYYSVCKTNSRRKPFSELIITNYDAAQVGA